jgi:hypothetical protein
MYLLFHPLVLFQSTAQSFYFTLLHVSATYSCHHQGARMLLLRLKQLITLLNVNVYATFS